VTHTSRLQWQWPFALACLILVPPKLELMSLGSGTLRFDDLALFLAAVSLGRYIPFAGPQLLRRLFLALLVTSCALLSAVLAGRVTLLSGILYSVRPFEYFLAFPIGYAISRGGGRSQWRRLVAFLAYLEACLSLAHFAGVNVGVSAFAYSRAAGSLGGPYELAAFSGLLFFVCLEERLVLPAFMTFGTLVLTASRVTLVITVAVLLILGRESWPVLRRALRIAAPALTAALVLLVVGGHVANVQILDRLVNTNVAPSIASGWHYAAETGPVETTQQYYYVVYGPRSAAFFAQADASSAIRFARWCVLMRSLRSPITVLLGLGPSFAGAAVDGQFVRYVVEGGLLTLLVWLLVWVHLLRRLPPGLTAGLIVLLGTGLFIDILVSARPMTLFWMLAGIWVAARDSTAEAQAPIVATVPRGDSSVV
jgi:hypothetical protein